MLDPREGDTVLCAKCGDSFEFEDLNQHDDGNLYCECCNYATEEEKLWDRADSLRAELENR